MSGKSHFHIEAFSASWVFHRQVDLHQPGQLIVLSPSAGCGFEIISKTFEYEMITISHNVSWPTVSLFSIPSVTGFQNKFITKNPTSPLENVSESAIVVSTNNAIGEGGFGQGFTGTVRNNGEQKEVVVKKPYNPKNNDLANKADAVNALCRTYKQAGQRKALYSDAQGTSLVGPR
jgi:hypothetical protein